jgi:hypothetical protein
MIAGTPLTSWRLPRFTLRRLLFLFVPLSVALSVVGYREHQKRQALAAFHRLYNKGIVLRAHRGLDRTVFFSNANVTDDDLVGFIPAFNSFAPQGFGKIIRIELVGSNVSESAIQTFRRRVPDCEIVR